MWTVSVPSSQFCCELKLGLKIKPVNFFKRKEMRGKESSRKRLEYVNPLWHGQDW